MLSRRGFLQGVCTASCLGAAPAVSFDYVARRDCIDVFRMRNGRRVRTQSAASERPAFVEIHPSGKFLFAVNEISEYQGLPAGSVESYLVDPVNGQLRLINRRPLSLSATLPRHFAISPDGRHMVVAAYGGGAYNVFPIRPDGELGAVAQIVKEIGRGPHPEKQTSAHPHSVVFHPAGNLLFGTDLGSDRINVFGFEKGRMTRLQQVEAPPGSGPARMTLDTARSLLLVSHEFSPLVARYRLDTTKSHNRAILI